LAAAIVGAVVIGIGMAVVRTPLLRVHGATSELAGAVTRSYLDGSVAELLGPGSELTKEMETPSRVVCRLRGGARFRVAHNPDRSFEVVSGAVQVRVLGTTFSVEQWPSGSTQVLVDQGRVEVRWPGGSTVLHSGEGGTFPPTDSAPKSIEAPVAGEPEERQAPAGAPASSANGRPSRDVASAAARKGWRDYAREGQYDRGFDELRSAGLDALGEDPTDLVLAADVARLSGHPEQALAPLRTLCERHPNDERAPVAAFTLGRVLLDDLGRPVEGAAAFAQARRLWPNGPLAEDALAREAESWQRAGKPDLATALVQEYLERYPNGRHAAAMQELMRRR
jgi:transmembrane sensor